MPKIIPPCHIDPQAELADDVEVGPFCVIGPGVKVGPRTRLMSHVTLQGPLTLGADNLVFPYAVLGGAPQDLGYRGEPTSVAIGDHNVIREYVTINRGTVKAHGVTKVGSHNLIMATAHIGHDCDIGNQIVLSNGALLAGHCRIEDRAIISGAVGFHHFVTVGKSAFVGGMSATSSDVPPFMISEGRPMRVRTVNVVGLRRQGYSAETIEVLKRACLTLFHSEILRKDALASLEPEAEKCLELAYLLNFMKESDLGKHNRALERFRKQPQPEQA